MDGFIVLTSLLSLPFGSDAKVVRSTQSLKPMRIVSRSRNIRVVIQALGSALPAVCNVAVILLSVWLIFGVIGMQLFMGKMDVCWPGPVPHRRHQSSDPIALLEQQQKDNCVAHGGVWKAQYQNFDNIVSALQVLFQVAVLVGWREICDVAMRFTSQAHGMFFVLFIFIGSFFLMSVVIGVLLNSFSEQKHLAEGSKFLTESQQSYLKAAKVLAQMKPMKTVITDADNANWV